MSLVLYNTWSKKEEVFRSLEEGTVGMYTCGPTVYGRPHIGNYSSFLAADLLRRWLEVSGYSVCQVKNITDVGHLVADGDDGEDKVEREAKKEQVDPLEIAERYTSEYLEDEQALNLLEPAHRPRATETITEMIAMIETLVSNGNAYETEDGVYFSVESFEGYGKLSGNTLDKLDSGSRVQVNEDKKHPADFALWKKCVGENANHILRWESPWGEGFPGWHIECSAMSTKFLGETIDIHTGGEDNIFPHHECEIAQSECASGKPFVKHWLHRRRIDLGDQTMSKSLGNGLYIPDIVERGFSALDLRYYFLSVHYRTNLKFSWKGLEDARKARRRVVEWVGELSANSYQLIAISLDSGLSFTQEFTRAMDSDLNTPAALAAVFDCMTWSRSQDLSKEEQSELQSFIRMVQHTFGCFDPEEDSEVPSEVQKLLEERLRARESKDFDASDRLRDEIKALGYEVRDENGGQNVRKI